MTTTIPPCVRGISDATLFDWRDGILAPEAIDDLTSHATTCPACRARMAQFTTARDALRRQQVPMLRDTIWRGVREEIQHPMARSTRRAIPSSRMVWAGGALAAILIATVSVAYLVVSVLGAPVSSTTMHDTPVPGQTATATLFPLANTTILTPEQAWGTSNSSSITSPVDLLESDILPDGSGILGTAYPDGNNAEIVLAPSTGAPVQIATDPYPGEEPYARTDGRYIVWLFDNQEKYVPIDVVDQSLSWFDRQTGNVQTIAVDAGYTFYSRSMVVSNGHVMVEEDGATKRIFEMDLATGAEMIIPSAGAFAADWPDIIYSTIPADGSEMPHIIVKNLQTGQTQDVSALLPAVPQNNIDADPPYQLRGDTIYTLFDSGRTLSGEEIAHVFTPGAVIHTLFSLRLTEAGAFFIRLGTRLIVVGYEQQPDQHNLSYFGLANVAFDLVQQRLVQLTPPNQGDVQINGDAVAYTSDFPSISSGMNYTVRDTALLPTKPVTP